MAVELRSMLPAENLLFEQDSDNTLVRPYAAAPFCRGNKKKIKIKKNRETKNTAL